MLTNAYAQWGSASGGASPDRIAFTKSYVLRPLELAQIMDLASLVMRGIRGTHALLQTTVLKVIAA